MQDVVAIDIGEVYVVVVDAVEARVLGSEVDDRGSDYDDTVGAKRGSELDALAEVHQVIVGRPNVHIYLAGAEEAAQ